MEETCGFPNKKEDRCGKETNYYYKISGYKIKGLKPYKIKIYCCKEHMEEIKKKKKWIKWGKKK